MSDNESTDDAPKEETLSEKYLAHQRYRQIYETRRRDCTMARMCVISEEKSDRIGNDDDIFEPRPNGQFEYLN